MPFAVENVMCFAMSVEILYIVFMYSVFLKMNVFSGSKPNAIISNMFS